MLVILAPVNHGTPEDTRYMHNCITRGMRVSMRPVLQESRRGELAREL